MNLDLKDAEQIAKHSFVLIGHDNKLRGLDALLVWQYVRCNQKYRRDYANLIKSLKEKPQDEEQNDFLVQTFCNCWCVSQPMDFNIGKIPEGFFFEYRLVRRIDNFAREHFLFDFNFDPQQPEVVLAINTRADRRLILKEIESYLDADNSDFAKESLRPNSLAHLPDNFFCYYLKKVMCFTNTEVKKQFAKQFAGWKIA